MGPIGGRPLLATSRRRWLCLLGATLALAACAGPQRPAWIMTERSCREVTPRLARIDVRLDGRAPEGWEPEKFTQYYPDMAVRRGVTSGHATIRCQVADHRLTACGIIEAAPADQAFGEAALKLARAVKLSWLPDTPALEVTFDFQVLSQGETRCS